MPQPDSDNPALVATDLRYNLLKQPNQDPSSAGFKKPSSVGEPDRNGTQVRITGSSRAALQDRVAQAILDSLRFEELQDVLEAAARFTTSLSPSQVDRLVLSARERLEQDEVLGTFIGPRHIYLIRALLDDPKIPSDFLDRFTERLRNFVYHRRARKMA